MIPKFSVPIEKLVNFYVVLVFASGCAFLPGRPTSNSVLSESEKAVQAEKISQAQDLFNKRKFAEAKQQFEDFLSTQPLSVYRIEATYGLARTEIEFENWSRARELLLEVLSFPSTPKSLAHSAALWLSEVHLAEGNEDKADAALFESQSNKAFLPEDDQDFFLPLFLGKQAIRRNEFEAAIKFFETTRKSILRRNLNDAEQNARLLFVMGSSPLSSDVSLSIKQFEVLQIFLIQSCELESTVWSEKSYQFLFSKYKAWFGQTKDPKLHKSQLEALVQNLVSANNTLTTPLKSASGWGMHLHRFVKRNLKLAQDKLLAWSGPMSQTQEAKERQSLRKDGIRLVPLNENSGQ